VGGFRWVYNYFRFFMQHLVVEKPSNENGNGCGFFFGSVDNAVVITSLYLSSLLFSFLLIITKRFCRRVGGGRLGGWVGGRVGGFGWVGLGGWVWVGGFGWVYNYV